MNIEPYLFKGKKLKNGEHPIMIRATLNRKSKYVTTKYSSPLNLWDSNKKKPRKRHPSYVEIDEYLTLEINKIKKAINKFKEEEKNFTLDDFKEVAKKKKKIIDVFTFGEEVIQRKKNIGKLKTAESYKNTLRAINRSLTKQQPLNFQDVNYRFLIRMEESLKQGGTGVNTIGIYMRTFRALYNMAIKEGLVDKKLYPFNDYKVGRLKEPARKRALKKEDIKKIEAIELKEGTMKWHMRNYFMFSYYCRGINFKDLAYLTWDNIRDGKLIYIRRKTGGLLNLKLLPEAWAILNHYKENLGSKGYVFPVLSEFHKTETQKEDRLNKVLGNMNDAMSELAKEIGLSFRVTSYFARHTYATVAKRGNVSTTKISEAMGHSHESVTQAYLDSFENSELDDAHEGIL